MQVIVRLVRSMDKIKEPAARSLIIWMFGEYNFMGNLIPKIVPAVLKYLAWSFTADVVETKLQILNASAKVCPKLKGSSSCQYPRLGSSSCLEIGNSLPFTGCNALSRRTHRRIQKDNCICH
jgi:vesicle coat complex subunit